jgi:pilus assembly protein CpaC
MYDNHFAEIRVARRDSLISAVASALAFALIASFTASAAAQSDQPEAVIRKVSNLSDKLELTTNSSRILTLDKNIPRVQVNNPELVAVTPLSAKEIQISAKKAGVTQVNLWDDQGGVHSIDVQIYGDARELTAALQTQFPHSSIKVYRYSESLVLTGFVDRPDHVGPIMRMAEDYAPKVINNINVGGVQQILLKVKVMEISRTKLRRMSTDFTWLDSSGSFFSTGVGGLLNNTTNIAGGGFQTATDTFGKAAEFGVVGNDSALFGFLDWVQENKVGKILAEPNLVAVSGRPAQFNVGGEIPIIVPQSLGTSSIEYKPFGTQIDFLPIVLGNGNIRLEVRPRISNLDLNNSVVLQDIRIPGLTVRQLDTAVEMKAGQTFALGGLVQERVDTIKRGIPYIMDVPVLGLPFRKDQDEVNEIELLILVTPEFVDPMDACEVPCGGPGTFTTSPTDHGIYCGGVIEVPTYCNPRQGLQSCGQDPCGNCSCNNGGGGCSTCNGSGVMPAGGPAVQITDGNVNLPGGTGYDDSPNTPSLMPTPVPSDKVPTQLPAPDTTPPQEPKLQHGAQNLPEDITLPVGTDEIDITTQSIPVTPVKSPAPAIPPQAPTQPASSAPPAPATGGSARTFVPASPQPTDNHSGSIMPGSVPQYTAPRPYSPQRQPVFMRNASRPYNPQAQPAQPAAPQRENSLIGPVGYDVQ